MARLATLCVLFVAWAAPIAAQHIDEWIETQGRLTRIYYELVGERTHGDVYANDKKALEDAGFDILADGFHPQPSQADNVGSRKWLGVYYAANALPSSAGIEPLAGSATALTAQSKPALDGIAKFLAARPDSSFYVVGHTDSTGGFDYNAKLSKDRAAAVVETLVAVYAVARERIEPYGVGPLDPVFTNSSEGGNEKNRRVELVER